MSTGRRFLESWIEEPESASQADLQLLAWYTIPYEGEGPRADLADAAERAVAPSFRAADGSPPGRDELHATLYDWIRPGIALGWIDHAALSYLLTDAGRPAACEGLIQRSHAPRSRP